MKALQLLFMGLKLLLFHPLAGHALDDECKKIVDTKKYLAKGEFDNTSSAEKTYKFEAIRNDLKEELISKEKVDSKKVNCLNDLYQQGIKDAASYSKDSTRYSTSLRYSARKPGRRKIHPGHYRCWTRPSIKIGFTALSESSIPFSSGSSFRCPALRVSEGF